jgi:hypothetical protein
MKEIIIMHEKSMRHTNRDFYIFEPKHAKEKFDALNQNMFEIFILSALTILGLLFPSVVAATFFVITHDLLYISNMKPSSRIFWG